MGAVTIYAIALMVSTCACILLAIFIWDRKPVQGTLWLVLFMLAMALWSTAYMLEILSPTIFEKYLFSNITFFSKTTMPVIWLVFALKYTGQEKSITVRNLALFLIIPIITIIAVWTNDLHGLIWRKIEVDYSNSIDVLTKTHGILFWFSGIYFYAMILVGAAIIIKTSVMSKALSGKVVVILAGIFLPLLIKAITVFKPDILSNLDVTPVIFTLCWCLVCWYAFRCRSLGMVPMARDMLIEEMIDGMIVVDMDGCVLYHNRAVTNIVHPSELTLVGKPIVQILPCYGNLAGMTGTTQVINLGKNRARKHFVVQVLLLHKRDNMHGGYLISLHDITERKIIEEQLQQYKEHLEELVEERTGALTEINAQLEAEISEHKQAKEALSESEAKCRSLIETTVAGVGIIDKAGKFVFVNAALCRMVGYPSEDILDKPFALFTHPDDIPSSMEKFKNASVQPHMTIDLEFRIVSKDKNIIWIHTNPVPIIVNGYPMGFSAILHDTTAHKRTEADLKESYATLQKSLEGTIRAVAKMAELRDPYTAGHQLRVAKLSAAIAREMHLPEDQINCIEIAANIHDVGKVYVPSEILSKPGKLTDLEFKMPMTHPQGSYDILRNIEFPWPIAQIVLQHHERMDGSGYPQGLKGEDIVLEARVLAVADVVEAMASHRPYRAALGLNEALEEIVMNKGKLYDAEIVEACERTFAEIEFEFE